MVDVGEMEDYLSSSSVKEGDVIEMLGEGSFEERTDNKGKVIRMLNIPVQANGNRKMIYSPGKKAREILVNAFGRDTKNWVNKKFSIKFVLMQIGTQEKQVVKPFPLISEKK